MVTSAVIVVSTDIVLVLRFAWSFRRCALSYILEVVFGYYTGNRRDCYISWSLSEPVRFSPFSESLHFSPKCFLCSGNNWSVWFPLIWVSLEIEVVFSRMFLGVYALKPINRTFSTSDICPTWSTHFLRLLAYRVLPSLLRWNWFLTSERPILPGCYALGVLHLSAGVKSRH
jgi:hypothetical protein